jgi:hypothetical protein
MGFIPAKMGFIWPDNDDAMDMIWHYHKIINLHVLVMRWDFAPELADNLAE